HADTVDGVVYHGRTAVLAEYLAARRAGVTPKRVIPLLHNKQQTTHRVLPANTVSPRTNCIAIKSNLPRKRKKR
ncbi:MAG TPA: hypothetical protein VFS02_19695, partial [Telluria sp.]|nr:hypothetical protein [Telluria sp.]